MNGPTDREIENHILYKLYRRRCWGEKHTDLDNVKKGIKKHLAGRYEKAAKRLIKKGLIIPKKVGYGSGLHISLNPRAQEEIMKRVQEYIASFMQDDNMNR